MPWAARLLFDECLGRPAIQQLMQFTGLARDEMPEIHHLFDFAPPGTFDEVWIPQLAPHGWTVITADGGRTPNRKRGEKLPHLCARFGVTHVILSPSVHNRATFEKLLTIFSVWYPLLELAADPGRRGRRYVLEPLPSSARGHGRLIEKEIPPSQLPTPPVPPPGPVAEP